VCWTLVCSFGPLFGSIWRDQACARRARGVDSNVVLFDQDLDVQGQIRTFTRCGNGLVCAGHYYDRLVAYIVLFGENRLVLDVIWCRFERGAF